MSKINVLLSGNEAIAEGSIQAGCKLYFGYPITPQNEIIEYMANNLPKVNGIFLQSESEIAAINMIFGSSAGGARVMTSSSSPGISLMQEGISCLAAAELPCVIVNVMRGGPGLGNIKASQSDYFQATSGGGHGDYKSIVLAPNSVQECYDITKRSFDLADIYRVPVIILIDGLIGQMVEPIQLKRYIPSKILPNKNWIVNGCKNRSPNIIRTLYLHPEDGLEELNKKLSQKYEEIKRELDEYELYKVDDAELVIVAYGVTSRIVKDSVISARKDGLLVGIIRPITLWPFPYKIISKIGKKCRKFLVVEMSNGQLVNDVRLAVNDKSNVSFYGFGGGWCPTPDSILKKIKEIY